jgi:hypothetical protein
VILWNGFLYLLQLKNIGRTVSRADASLARRTRFSGWSWPIYSAEPSSASEDAIRQLARWAATNQQFNPIESARMADGS